MHAMTIGVDLAKRVFEVAIANERWRVVEHHRYSRTQFGRFLQRQPAAHVVMEACGTAHFWGRLARERGHAVTLLPGQYVRPYVRRNKTDRTDAEALLEAVRSGGIHPVTIKTARQQEWLAWHRIRAQWMATRTARINAMRALLLEQGVVIAAGARAALAAVPTLLADGDQPIPMGLRQVVGALYDEVRELNARITGVERALAEASRDDAAVARLRTIPGVGLLTATALVATVGHIQSFRRARAFASWVGLTPREYSSGAHRRLGGISKRGDTYLRCLLVHGARAVVLAARRRVTAGRPVTALHVWALSVQHRRGHNKATIAVANKLARIIWAVWSREGTYVAGPALPHAA